MDDKTLLNALVGDALVSQEMIPQILNEAAQAGKTAEEVLFDRRIIDGATLAQTKSKILGIPYKKIESDKIESTLFKIIPQETAETYKVIPVELKNNTLIVGMVRPWDVRAQEALRFIAKQNNLNLGIYVVSTGDVEVVLRKYSPYSSEVEKAVKALNIGGKRGSGSAALRSISLEEESGVSEEAPVIKLVSSTLTAAVEMGASDIHIEPERTRIRVRLRVDGILQEVSSLPIEIHQAIVSRIKILSNLKIDETRIPQDGRFRTVVFSRDIDFRVSTFPTPLGEKVVLRVLDPTMGLKSVGDLGLVGKTKELASKALAEPFGMILITGPTGSGKTTTMYSLLQTVDRKTRNVVSLEDPVEYFIDGVSQSQVKPEIGYTFASGLRQILRQDPDIIMVGEIRDNETAKLAVHAALTGHIVLATLHTNNATGVIPRLIDMGVESFLLPSSLSLMVSQRLVRRLCDKCKTATVAPPEVQTIIENELGLLQDSIKSSLQYKPPYKTYKSSGCKVCGNKGIVGRIALFEGFDMTHELGKIVNEGLTEGNLIEEAKRQGMVTLRQDGILKALEGIISIEDVIRETASSL